MLFLFIFLFFILAKLKIPHNTIYHTIHLTFLDSTFPRYLTPGNTQSHQWRQEQDQTRDIPSTIPFSFHPIVELPLQTPSHNWTQIQKYRMSRISKATGKMAERSKAPR